MTTYSLKLLKDQVARYAVFADAQRIGEVRYHAMHADVLYLGDQALWLVADAVADAAAREASLLVRFANMLRLNRSYSLRDASSTLAQARRHWNPLRGRDWIDYEAAPAAPLRATPRGMLNGGIDLVRAGAPAGSMRVVGLLQDSVTLDAPGFESAQAALLMYAVHRCWGANPNVGHQPP